MIRRPVAIAAAPLIVFGLAACEPVASSDPALQPGHAVTLPDSVASIAAPNQDLSSARYLPSDGCYWYVHKGPVETTLLPLRTKGGNPICTRQSG